MDAKSKGQRRLTLPFVFLVLFSSVVEL